MARAKSGMRADAKQRRILEVATDLFFERGYSGTTIDAICEKLGVTRPFIYYYFKDKLQIWETITFDAAANTFASFRIGMRGKEALGERIEGALRAFVASNVGRFKAGSLYSRERQNLSTKARTELDRMQRRFNQELVALLAEGVKGGVLPEQDVKITALAIGGTVGYLYMWYKPDGSLAPEQVVDRLTSFILRGIGLGAKKAKPRSMRRGA